MLPLMTLNTEYMEAAGVPRWRRLRTNDLTASFIEDIQQMSGDELRP